MKDRWHPRQAGLWLVLVLMAFAGAPPVHAAEPSPIPVEAFYRHADMDEVALSPSGRQLALTSGVGSDRVALAVFDLSGGAQPRIVARFNDADIYSFRWVNEDYLVFNLVDRTLGGGDQRRAPGLFSVKADGSGMRQLIKMNRDVYVSQRQNERLLEWDHELLTVPETGEAKVIVGRVTRSAIGDVESIAPLLLDVQTQQTRSLAMGAPDGATGWWFDAKGRAWLVSTTRDGTSTYHWRASEDSGWKPIASGPSLRMPFYAHSADTDGQLFVTAARGEAGYGALHRFDFSSGKPEPAPLVSTPGFDFSGTLVGSYGEGRTLGVRTTTDAETTVWFDPRLRELQKAVDQRLPGRVNRLTCRRCQSDDAVVLVRSWSDQHPGEYWIHRPADDQWQRVGAVHGDIDPRRMGQLDLHRIKARDGLEIPVWVTRPAGDAATPRPAVLLVHGGPWVRGRRWEWNADAQFLASRGYVVIEPEFRGSTGYGGRHFKAGWKQWGAAMQDDLVDAVKWAAGRGWIDPKRVCIAGASYGGYATLMGLARDPEVFRCGAAWVAVSDPRLLFGLPWVNDISQEARQHSLPVLIGDPKADAERLAAVAPVELAGRIKGPLLLAYGREDTRVPLEHGERMRDALRKAGLEPQWVVYPDEWHGWFKAETRYDFARRLEAFLASSLK